METNGNLGIVVYGATGYTGKLVAEYLNAEYGVGGSVPWAIAGRSMARLESVRDELGLPENLPLVVADATDPDSIAHLATSADVILTTVGPYQLYGSELVAACAAAGTDYVDLCGEPAWMLDMISKHSEAAAISGARIVFSCGFDSIPFDLGVLFLQESAGERYGAVMPRVRGRVRAMQGTWSGGTLASFKTTMEAAAKDPEVVAALMNPFALTPGFTGASQPTGHEPLYDEVIGSWVAPFVMATINTKTIHRSNLLLAHRYGVDFVYDEMLITGPGEQGETAARAVAADTSMAEDTTQPGEGPTREQRESGFYDLLFVGQGADGEQLTACVRGDMDPGYGSTSKMIAESAICLLQTHGSASGGILTPAAALGMPLVQRLRQHAGLSFELEES